jgi:hypothetical protein
MIDFDNLLIIGDSFCSHSSAETDWPVVLGKLLKVPMTCFGRPGNSWWSNYRDLKNYKPPQDKKTLLIVIHTESQRLPNDNNIAATPGIIFTAPGAINDLSRYKNGNELARIAKDFYTSELFSSEFYDWAQQAWIKELDQRPDFVKVFHIPAFDSVDLSLIKNGLVIHPSANTRSLRKLSSNEILGDSIRWQGPDSRHNHFNKTNNIRFGEALANIISTATINETGVKYIDNLESWDFTKRPFTRPSFMNKLALGK